jgi:hypothetical protein
MPVAFIFIDFAGVGEVGADANDALFTPVPWPRPLATVPSSSLPPQRQGLTRRWDAGARTLADGRGGLRFDAAAAVLVGELA